MSLPYEARLFCLCFAAFFVLHAAFGTAVIGLHPRLMRFKLTPGTAASMWFWVRLLPPLLSMALVGGLAIPGYLVFEPEAPGERIGVHVIVSALIGLAVITAGITRGMTSLRRPPISVERHGGFWVADTEAPILRLEGVLRTRVVIGRRLLADLSPAQLQAALRHEMAHSRSRDNLKRLALQVAPGLLPWFRGFDGLERAWASLAERGADDAAVAGEPDSSVDLASALVAVARAGVAPESTLATPFVSTADDLAERVDRLLERAPTRDIRMPAAMALVVLCLLPPLIAMQPGVLRVVYAFVEGLLH